MAEQELDQVVVLPQQTHTCIHRLVGATHRDALSHHLQAFAWRQVQAVDQQLPRCGTDAERGLQHTDVALPEHQLHVALRGGVGIAPQQLQQGPFLAAGQLQVGALQQLHGAYVHLLGE